jgi:hypothetical protein
VDNRATDLVREIRLTREQGFNFCQFFIVIFLLFGIFGVVFMKTGSFDLDLCLDVCVYIGVFILIIYFLLIFALKRYYIEFPVLFMFSLAALLFKSALQLKHAHLLELVFASYAVFILSKNGCEFLDDLFTYDRWMQVFNGLFLGVSFKLSSLSYTTFEVITLFMFIILRLFNEFLGKKTYRILSNFSFSFFYLIHCCSIFLGVLTLLIQAKNDVYLPINALLFTVDAFIISNSLRKSQANKAKLRKSKVDEEIEYLTLTQKIFEILGQQWCMCIGFLFLILKLLYVLVVCVYGNNNFMTKIYNSIFFKFY